MSWIGKVFSSGAGTFIDKAGSAIKKFVTTDEDRIKLANELEKILQERDAEVEQTIRAELRAKGRVLAAELNQGDNYTKRARPTVVYAGLVFIAINYILVPAIGAAALPLPTEFWVAWGGICSVWSIGRSAEKRGTRNKLTGAITGNQPTSSLLD